MISLEKFSTIYMGYYNGKSYKNPIILCVSDNLKILKYYLKDIRNLNKSQYEIKEVVLDLESAYSLYEDFMLEEFNDDYLYLTNRDIQALNNDIESGLEHLEKSYNSLKEYRDFVFNIKKFRPTVSVIDQTLNVMYNQLASSKNIKKLALQLVKESPITSSNIIEYINYTEIVEEDKKLTDLFYKKVYN